MNMNSIRAHRYDHRQPKFEIASNYDDDMDDIEKSCKDMQAFVEISRTCRLTVKS
jgi:hypothetical protein